MRFPFLALLVACSSPFSLPASAQGDIHAPSRYEILITITDENNVSVPRARVTLQTAPTSPISYCETDIRGQCLIGNLAQSTYQLTVSKQGFYVLSGQAVQVGSVPEVSIKLSHLQEVKETVNVSATPPQVDPSQVTANEQLTGIDILNIPYSATHDYRNVLHFIPGVVSDNQGQPHLMGAETFQSLTLLDGFNVTQPANGLLLLRISTDAIRLVNVQGSRVSAEYGKGSGGVLSIDTGMGDDRLRYSATNFLPSAQLKKGFHFDKVVPRATVSGPIIKRKMWFFEGLDGEYRHSVIPELPDGADMDKFWRAGNMAKLQINPTSANVLTLSYLYNIQHDEFFGLSAFTPQLSTPSNTDTGHFATIRDQHSFGGGALLDFGFNYDRYTSKLLPHVPSPSVISNSQSASGGYYLTSRTRADRWQSVANLSLSNQQWGGRHEIKFGVDVDRLTYHPFFDRKPISYLRVGETLPSGTTCLTLNSFAQSPCSRYSLFTTGQGTTFNLEAGSYLQDRWSPSDRLLIEPGIRLDWDEIVREVSFSPRLGTTYVLDSRGDTKFSAGVGIYHDASNLMLISSSFSGARFDYFFSDAGTPIPSSSCSQPPLCPLPTTFTVDRATLQAPRFVNWSLALERKLLTGLYAKAEFIQRRGTHGFVYNQPGNSPLLSGNFLLQNTRQDHFDSFQLAARYGFRKSYLLTGSFIRSRTRSDQVLDFRVDNPIFSPQLPGPFPWDAPNRFLSTGIFPARLPFLRDVDIEYSSEARSGFPFYVINNQQVLVRLPGAYRFPWYFSLNLFVEKRFRFHNHHWAVRGGFDDITGRHNPFLVNNNIDSPGFLTFAGTQHRAFTTRIRLIK